jgi:cytochrome bd-type quinol oxidase subunit 2
MTGRDHFLQRVRPAYVALAVGAVIVAIAVAYAGPQHGGRGLDGERTFPALFSGALLLAAGMAGLVAARARRPGRARWALIALSLLLVWLSFDEVARFHERVERFVGVEWLLLYAPLGVAGAAAALIIAMELRDRTVTWLIAGGTLVWAASQALEGWQWGGPTDVTLLHPQAIFYEEILEMCGSACFLLMFLVLIRRSPARST